MTGKHNGVAARLKQRHPMLTSVHCIAHQLALAASQSGGGVPYISKTFKPTVRQLFYYYQNSAVRMKSTKVQTLGAVPLIDGLSAFTRDLPLVVAHGESDTG